MAGIPWEFSGEAGSLSGSTVNIYIRAELRSVVTQSHSALGTNTGQNSTRFKPKKKYLFNQVINQFLPVTSQPAAYLSKQLLLAESVLPSQSDSSVAVVSHLPVWEPQTRRTITKVLSFKNGIAW